MSRPNPQEVAEERQMQENLVLAVTDSLTALSTQELNRWSYRAAIMADIDQGLDRIIGASDEKPDLAKLVLCVVLWKTINRLLSPIEAAPKAKPAGGALTELSKQLQPRNQRRRRAKSYGAGWLRRKVAAMTPDELEAYRQRERARSAARRLKAKAQLVPGP